MTADDLGRRLDRALDRLRTATGVSLAFGGPVGRSGALLLERFSGRTVGALAGVRLVPGHGLGGRASALGKPVVTHDYLRDEAITHSYDRVIRAEGLRAMAAAPVIVGGRTVAVLYGALRTAEAVGERLQDALAHEVRTVEQELAVVAARATSVRSPDAAADDAARLREKVRATHSRLRVLAARIDDRAVRDELLRLTEDLGEPADEPPVGRLTRREVDVLALAGGGMSNAQIAGVLGLTVHTVKGYFKGAMAKLSAETRLEAVVRARRAGLLP